ncbi:MAG: hypothetical protein RR012_03820 [Oscillospiraceae bacterium]
MRNKYILSAIIFFIIASCSSGVLYLNNINQNGAGSNSIASGNGSSYVSDATKNQDKNSNNNKDKNQKDDVASSSNGRSKPNVNGNPNSTTASDGKSSAKTDQGGSENRGNSSNGKDKSTPKADPVKNSSGSKTPQEAQPATTIEQSNEQRIQNIFTKYGITVQAGTTADVWYKGSCYGITDSKLIASWLDIIEKQLARYPSGFFMDLNDITTLKIKLLKTIPEASGFASHEISTDMFIALNTSIGTSGFPDRVFNHEIMHIIDRYIYLKSWNAAADAYLSPLDATTAIVPAGFSWGDTSNANTTIDKNVAVQERYFVTAYAKTNDKEDRAETFTDYMFRPYKKEYMQDPSYPIPRKQAIIAKSIRDYFPSAARTAKGSLAWEKLL